MYFRGILYVARDQAWLVPRKRKKLRQFDPLRKQVLRSLKGQRALLDGEIVVLDERGRSNFYDLMARRGEPRYYAFDPDRTYVASRFWRASEGSAG